MSEPGGGQIERALAVRERTHTPGTAPDLAHDPLERIVGADPPPVLARKGHRGERLGNRRRDPLCQLAQLHAFEFRDDRELLSLPLPAAG